MYGGSTSADFGGDVVAMVKANKAKAEAEQAAKLEAARAAVLAEGATRQSLVDAVAAKQQQAAEAAEAQRIAADEQRERTLALFAWQRAGGTAESFDAEWPEMRRKQIAERVTNANAMRQQATQQMYRSIF